MSLTYAIGDIHGSLRKLHRLIAHCQHHAQGRPVTFVFLGDYLNGLHGSRRKKYQSHFSMWGSPAAPKPKVFATPTT